MLLLLLNSKARESVLLSSLMRHEILWQKERISMLGVWGMNNIEKTKIELESAAVRQL